MAISDGDTFVKVRCILRRIGLMVISDSHAFVSVRSSSFFRRIGLWQSQMVTHSSMYDVFLRRIGLIAISDSRTLVNARCFLRRKGLMTISVGHTIVDIRFFKLRIYICSNVRWSHIRQNTMHFKTYRAYGNLRWSHSRRCTIFF